MRRQSGKQDKRKRYKRKRERMEGRSRKTVKQNKIKNREE